MIIIIIIIRLWWPPFWCVYYLIPSIRFALLLLSMCCCWGYSWESWTQQLLALLYGLYCYPVDWTVGSFLLCDIYGWSSQGTERNWGQFVNMYTCTHLYIMYYKSIVYYLILRDLLVKTACKPSSVHGAFWLVSTG